MAGVRLGGIDPSILRELSGVYKPLWSAIIELPRRKRVDVDRPYEVPYKAPLDNDAPCSDNSEA
jgi:hypothetical protein